MRGGILRHRVTFEAPQTGVDDWGQPLSGWTTVASSVPAEVRDIRGREFWGGQQVPVGEVTTRVRIRYRTDLTRQMRVTHDGRHLLIEAILDPDGKRTELHVMCQEQS